MITPTLQNVADLLGHIGLDAQVMHVAHGWSRVFATDRKSRCQVGRIMFRFGEYRHPHWYGHNFMERMVHDDFYFSDAWECLLETGAVLTWEEWCGIRATAKARAQARYEEKLALRAKLDAEKPLGQKWSKHLRRMVQRRRRKIEPPNVLGQMGPLLDEWVAEKNGIAKVFNLGS